MFIFTVIALVSLMIRQIVLSIKYLHIIQLEGYKLNNYFRWVSKNFFKVFLPDLIFAVISCSLFLILIDTYDVEILFKGFLVLLITFNIITSLFKIKTPAKKKLVYTSRLIRLLLMTLMLALIENSAVIRYALLLSIDTSKHQHFYTIISMLAVGFLTPINVYLANLINYPLERSIQSGFKKMAQKKLSQMSKLKTIGVTGSYGKTSVKNILNMLLIGKYSVVMSPSSFNTPMGLCKVVNDQLTDKNEIFIAEMGARNKGDIKELCEIVTPKIGIITSIGPQHLETFKTIEKIAKTKFELIDALPEDGVAVLNGDNEYCIKYKDTCKCKVVTFGVDNTSCDITASDIRYSKHGTNFILKDKSENKIICSTKLLGLHNVYNILAAACAAIELGVTLERIGHAVKALEPIEHRLQIVPTNNGVTVIDDAFNSNPVGSKMALDVIKTFSGNKIIVTPGMVELGKMEYAHNKEFGKNIALVCNAAILVGKKRSKPIVEGLLEAGFPQQRIAIAKSLNDATNILSKIIKPGDVVLFENDLPDNYNE